MKFSDESIKEKITGILICIISICAVLSIPMFLIYIYLEDIGYMRTADQILTVYVLVFVIASILCPIFNRCELKNIAKGFILALTLAISIIYVRNNETTKNEELYTTRYESLKENLTKTYAIYSATLYSTLKDESISMDDIAEKESNFYETYSKCIIWNQEIIELKSKKESLFGTLYPDYYEELETLPTDVYSESINTLYRTYEKMADEMQEERVLKEKCSTYTIYLDGELVEYEKIDISLYKVSVDDENEVIYLARYKE